MQSLGIIIEDLKKSFTGLMLDKTLSISQRLIKMDDIARVAIGLLENLNATPVGQQKLDIYSDTLGAFVYRPYENNEPLTDEVFLTLEGAIANFGNVDTVRNITEKDLHTGIIWMATEDVLWVGNEYGDLQDVRYLAVEKVRVKP